MLKKIGIAVLAISICSPLAFAQGKGHGKGKAKHEVAEASEPSRSAVSMRVFSDRDRDIIRSCFTDDREGLPPGLAKRDRLPPGLERHLQKNGTLPPGLQKKVQPLPSRCDTRLPRLPRDIARVVLGDWVILRDRRSRILDLFQLEIR